MANHINMDDDGFFQDNVDLDGGLDGGNDFQYKPMVTESSLKPLVTEIDLKPMVVYKGI